MNYYQYKKRKSRKSILDYFKPFLVIIIFIGIIFGGWKLLSGLFINDKVSLSNERVELSIESGSARAMTAGSSEWKNVPTEIFLYEGESLKTQSDGRASLSFFNGYVSRMDKSTELDLMVLKKTGSQSEIALSVQDGKIWINSTNSSFPENKLTIKTDLLELDASDAIISVTEPGTVYVLQGEVTAKIMNKKDVVKETIVGVGQQLVVTDQVISDLSDELSKEILFAIDDTFKTSNWYRWNKQKDGASDVELEDEIALDDETSTEDDEEDTSATDEEADDSTDTTDDEEVVEEEEPEEEEEEDLSDDTEAPSKPVIKVPGSNGESVTLDALDQKITGTVSSDTAAVIVNDYKLSLFKLGDGEFTYTANVAYKNLEVGENEYEVIAEDKAGNKSTAAIITLVLTQEVYDDLMEETEEDTSSDETTDTSEAATSSGGVSITSPNGGDNLSTSETSFEIKGEVPEGTTKVLVNNYQLQGFTEGGTSFLYRANTTLGTLEIGEQNTYTVKAYKDEELLGSASMTIDVESSASGEGNPTITIPVSSGSYETTLDQIVIGGIAGKWVEMIYINGAKLNDYIPGSQEWRKTVTLSPGENTYSIYGTKGGEQTPSVSISVDYQN